MTHRHRWQYNDAILPGNHRACECGRVEHEVQSEKRKRWVLCEHIKAEDVL